MQQSTQPVAQLPPTTMADLADFADDATAAEVAARLKYVGLSARAAGKDVSVDVADGTLNALSVLAVAAHTLAETRAVARALHAMDKALTAAVRAYHDDEAPCEAIGEMEMALGWIKVIDGNGVYTNLHPDGADDEWRAGRGPK